MYMSKVQSMHWTYFPLKNIHENCQVVNMTFVNLFKKRATWKLLDLFLHLINRPTNKVKLCSGRIPYCSTSFALFTLGRSGSLSLIQSIFTTCWWFILAGKDFASYRINGGRFGSGINLVKMEKKTQNNKKTTPKTFYNYFQSEAKQKGIKFISQVYTYLEVVLLFQMNKILKTHALAVSSLSSKRSTPEKLQSLCFLSLSIVQEWMMEKGWLILLHPK